MCVGGGGVCVCVCECVCVCSKFLQWIKMAEYKLYFVYVPGSLNFEFFITSIVY